MPELSAATFTFHYVSIKTLHDPCHICLCELFTFHYVSIKTHSTKHPINSLKTLLILSTSFFTSSLSHHFILIISYTPTKSNTKLYCQPPLFLTLSTIDNIIKRNLFCHPPCPTFLYLTIFLDGF